MHVRNFSEADTQNLIEFVTGYSPFWGLKSAQAETYFRWLYCRNPFGTSHLGLAFDENGQLIGFEGLVRWKLLFGENEISCVKGENMLTHPAHRGRGIASALASYLNTEAQRSGIQLRLSPIHNPTESRVLQKAGLRQVRDCVVYHAKVYNYVPVLMGRLKSKLRKTTPAHPVDKDFIKDPLMSVQTLVSQDGFSNLLKQDRQQYDQHRLTTPRKIEYVNWRYGEHPTITYYTTAVKEGNSLTAAAIFRPRLGPQGFKIIELRELFVDRDEAILTLLEKLLRTTRAAYVEGGWSPSSTKHQILRSLGFKPTADRIHLLVKILNPGMMGTPFQPGGWNINASEIERN